MWRMLQQPEADDYVLATGEVRSVRDFVEMAFREVGRTIEWKGEGIDEVGLDAKDGRTLVQIDARYFRPTEVDYLCGDASKAKEKLGWTAKVTVEEMAREMVAADIEVLQRSGERRASQI
jgi:GDPmannose 4,6-dehydratase